MIMLRRAFAAAVLLALAGCAVPGYGPVAYGGYYGYPYAYYGYPYAFGGTGFFFFPHHRHFFFLRHGHFPHRFAPRFDRGFAAGEMHRGFAGAHPHFEGMHGGVAAAHGGFGGRGNRREWSEGLGGRR
ncbi:MAG: hypothetical protein ACRD2G_12125 [Terriglobia bacterium]